MRRPRRGDDLHRHAAFQTLMPRLHWDIDTGIGVTRIGIIVNFKGACGAAAIAARS